MFRDFQIDKSPLRVFITPEKGSVNCGHVHDRLFKLDYEEGSILIFKSFSYWAGATATRQKPGPGGFKKDSYRDYLSDTGEICFTNGDLTFENITIDW